VNEPEPEPEPESDENKQILERIAQMLTKLIKAHR